MYLIYSYDTLWLGIAPEGGNKIIVSQGAERLTSGIAIS